VEPFSLHEHATFWLDPDLDNLELLRATYITHAFAPHAHEGFAIGVIEAGGQAFTYRRSTGLVMPAGSVAVINPGVVHTGRAATGQGWTYRMLYPAAAVLQRAAAQLVGRDRGVPAFATPVIHDPALAAQLLQLHRALEGRATTRLERESRLLWTLAQLITRHADAPHSPHEVGREPAVVRQARDYLAAHRTEPVSLDDLADQVQLSPFHLLRVFRAAVGMPPHAYQIQLRVARAKELLRAGMPIAAVAVEVGFVDQSHLTRHFKRLVGVPPGRYRVRRG
jgi:AraC-like DNA-binding protein